MIFLSFQLIFHVSCNEGIMKMLYEGNRVEKNALHIEFNSYNLFYEEFRKYQNEKKSH